MKKFCVLIFLSIPFGIGARKPPSSSVKEAARAVRFSDSQRVKQNKTDFLEQASFNRALSSSIGTQHISDAKKSYALLDNRFLVRALLVASSKALQDMQADSGTSYRDGISETDNCLKKLYSLAHIINDDEALAQHFADRAQYAGPLSLAGVVKAADFLDIPSVIHSALNEIVNRLIEPIALEQFKEGRHWKLGLSKHVESLFVKKITPKITALIEPIFVGTKTAKNENVSPDGKMVATIKNDMIITLINAQTRNRLKTFKIRREIMMGPAWSPDSTQLAFMSNDETVFVLNAMDQVTRSLGNNQQYNATFAWAPDSKKLAIGSTSLNLEVLKTSIYDLMTGKYTIDFSERCRKESHCLFPHIVKIAWSPDGKRIFTLSTNSGGKVWDASTGRLLYNFLSGFFIASASWSPDSTCIVALSNDCMIKVWDAIANKLLHTIKKQSAQSVTWDHDGIQIVFEKDKRVEVWSTGLQEQLNRDQLMLIMLIQHEYRHNNKLALNKNLKEIYETLPQSIKKSLKEQYDLS